MERTTNNFQSNLGSSQCPEWRIDIPAVEGTDEQQSAIGERVRSFVGGVREGQALARLMDPDLFVRVYQFDTQLLLERGPDLVSFIPDSSELRRRIDDLIAAHGKRTAVEYLISKLCVASNVKERERQYRFEQIVGRECTAIIQQAYYALEEGKEFDPEQVINFFKTALAEHEAACKQTSLPYRILADGSTIASLITMVFFPEYAFAQEVFNTISLATRAEETVKKWLPSPYELTTWDPSEATGDEAV